MAAGSKCKGMVLTYRTFKSIGIGRKLFVRRGVKARVGNRLWIDAGMISSTWGLQDLIAAPVLTWLSGRARKVGRGGLTSNRKSCTKPYGRLAYVRTRRNLKRSVGIEQGLKGPYLKECERSG